MRSALTSVGDSGWWRFDAWHRLGVIAGVGDRHATPASMASQLPAHLRFVRAQQVHGASVALIERPLVGELPIAGCDALLTRARDCALAIQTADCLPIFIADPVRRAVGLAHVGWRGLAAQLPMRCLAAFRHAFHSALAELRVVIGPAIHACCYEVGPEFVERFGPFVHRREGRTTCDLIGVAVTQLVQAGLHLRQIVDSQQCTACHTDRWFSLRREGPATGRLTSIIMLT